MQKIRNLPHFTSDQLRPGDVWYGSSRELATEHRSGSPKTEESPTIGKLTFPEHFSYDDCSESESCEPGHIWHVSVLVAADDTQDSELRNEKDDGYVRKVRTNRVTVVHEMKRFVIRGYRIISVVLVPHLSRKQKEKRTTLRELFLLNVQTSGIYIQNFSHV